MTRILIINLHSSYNAGDAALALAASQQLHEAFPGSTVTLSMNDPDSHPDGDIKAGSFMHWFHPINTRNRWKWSPREILRLGTVSLLALFTYRVFKHPIYPFLSSDQKKFLQAYFNADIIASAPGNFLYSSGRVGVSFFAAIYAMTYAIWAGKPLYILPQSIGPFNHWWERCLVKKILNRARLILVREEESIEQLKRIMVSNPNIVLQPDMAFSFQAASSDEAKHWLLSKGININQNEPFLGITTINWGEQTGQHHLQQQYETALTDTVRYFIEHIHGKVIFFPQVTGMVISADDRLPAKRIIKSLGSIRNQIVLIEEPPSPAILKAAYGWMDILIGTRMHSNIFALSCGVPVLAIAYRHKTVGMMHMLGLDEWMINLQSINSSGITERLAALWEQKRAVSDHIQEVLPVILHESSRTGSLVAKNYLEYQQNHT